MEVVYCFQQFIIFLQIIYWTLFIKIHQTMELTLSTSRYYYFTSRCSVPLISVRATVLFFSSFQHRISLWIAQCTVHIGIFWYSLQAVNRICKVWVFLSLVPVTLVLVSNMCSSLPTSTEISFISQVWKGDIQLHRSGCIFKLNGEGGKK